MRDARRRGVPRRAAALVFHAALGSLLILIAVAAEHAPDWYEQAMQEDGFVEWASAGLFLAAFVLRTVAAARHRRVFDVLVALFCLFVAGEELSWGQRLVGYEPPAVFLEHNTQQETTFHNFAAIFGKPKWVLASALFTFGVLLPAISIPRRGAALLGRLRLTAPALSLAPWFAALVVLLVWYPLTYTGEWVEMIAGLLFLVSSPSGGVPAAGVLALAGAAAMTLITSARDAATTTSDPRLACARAETQALLSDVLVGAATEQISEVSSLEKRLWTAAHEGYLRLDALAAFREAPCSLLSAKRREFAVDPWGLAYWIETDEKNGAADVSIYSFGPNRQRGGGDDVRSTAELSYADLLK